jgi:multiple sugar transport system permease protein
MTAQETRFQAHDFTTRTYRLLLYLAVGIGAVIFAVPFYWMIRTALNSFQVAILSTLGAVISSSIVGFSFARLRFPFRDALFLLVIATIILPEQVRLIPTYLLFAKLGWVNSYLPLVVPKWFAPAFHVFLLRQFFLTMERLPTPIDLHSPK